MIKQTGVTTRKRSPDILLAIAHQLARRPLRPALPEQLRLHAHQGRAGAAAGRQRRDHVRPARLQHADLARPRQAGRAQHDGRRRGRAPSASRTSRSPPARSASRRSAEGQQIQVTLSTLGRLVEPEQFEKIIVKTTADGRMVRLKDVGRVELGAKNQDISEPRSTAEARRPAWPSSSSPTPTRWRPPTSSRPRSRSCKKDFPEGIDYEIRYDTTPFIRESIEEVFKTLLDAVILVALVVLLFLQNWRSALIPLVAVPVAIIGTFAVMAAFGFSLNNLTLFGLVLAIGIVVDDAIVVVEAVEHHIEHGHGAARRDDPGDGARCPAPVIAVGPGALGGVRPLRVHLRDHRPVLPPVRPDDRRRRRCISAFNSLTLSPALAAMLLRPRQKGDVPGACRGSAFLALGGLGRATSGWARCCFPTSSGSGLIGQVVAAGIAARPGLDGSSATRRGRVGPGRRVVGGLARLGRSAGRSTGLLGWFFDLFNRGVHGHRPRCYSRLVGGMLRRLRRWCFARLRRAALA